MTTCSVHQRVGTMGLLLVLLMGLGACERMGPLIPVASTAGPAVIVIETEDGASQWSGPLVMTGRTRRILIGGEMSGEESFCDRETTNPVAMVRVLDAASDDVLWERPATRFTLCRGDRLLWNGDDLRHLERHEGWPEGVTVAE